MPILDEGPLAFVSLWRQGAAPETHGCVLYELVSWDHHCVRPDGGAFPYGDFAS